MTEQSVRARVFVFGSNLAGHHGAGAALRARLAYGAIGGRGVGHCGQSYAIPTKSKQIRTLTLRAISGYVTDFVVFARIRQDLQFNVTQVGCGLAGLKPEQIAPMFVRAPANCWFDREWAPWLPPGTKFWTDELPQGEAL